MSGTSAATAANASGAASAIFDRFRIEAVLGRGGMGEVLSVVELATGKPFALKRLLPGAKARHAMLLSREFHTLSGLKHPHVVQAFDYGTSAGVPYYTMELLQGSDVESLGPLPFSEVVPILRGVASALSLIHARHLIHRDVGARNVWRTPEGVVKLIDFGALTSFGASPDIAGTAPYVAPEALRTRVLDQRTDLYSLGALGYLLLTGGHAYGARGLAQLEQHWAEGLVAPSARLAATQRADLPEIPERLEQLIEALLSLAPEGRPSSAAEVLDQLAIVLPGQAVVAESALEGVLASKAFAGRVNEQKRLKGLLKRTLSHAGASVALLGPAGVGRSRLLSEFALEARTAGAALIRVSADGEGGALSGATAATLMLLQNVPAEARAAAATHARVLGHLSPELCAALELAPADLERFPALLGEARMRIQSALHTLWLEVSTKRPIVLLIDDLERMDEASSALFATLGRDAAAAQLLVVAAVRSEQERLVPAIAQPFVEKAVVLGLTGLLEDESVEMLRSMFGDTDHLLRTAQYLSGKAEGNPGRLMELCDHLVRSQKIRCHDGAWVLPQEPTELALPASFEQIDEARLSRLSPSARALARALSVVEGALPLELCSALSPLPPESMFAALSDLCAGGVLVQGEQGYGFRRGPLRDVLVASLDADEAERAHAAAGVALLANEQASLVDRMSAGVHLLRGGRAQQGAAVVQRGVSDMVDELPEERAEIAYQVERALVYLEPLKLDDYQMISYLCALAWCGYFVDRRLGLKYGDRALACAQRVCGMQLARRLSPWLGKKLGLYVALMVAAVRLRRRARKSPLVPDFQLAMRFLLLASGSLSGMYALCIDRKKVLETASAIEPLAALGPDHIASVVYRFGMGCVGNVSNQLGDTRRHWEQLIARLDDTRPIKGLHGTQREYYRAASMYAWGSSECWRDKSRALEIADRLEQQPLKLYQLSADQLRSQYHAHQGNMRQAAHYKARVETRALQRGMTWQVEIWEPSAAYSLGLRQLDALGVKRAAGQLSHLSADTPSLRGYVDASRAAYLLLRGRHVEALALLETLLPQRDDKLVGYATAVAMLARAYNGLNRFAEAKAAATGALAKLSPEDLMFPGMTLQLQIELALAEAGLGQHDVAAAQLDALIARHTPNEGPLTLGALHDARASVALRAQQEAVARQHVEMMERWYRTTDCPALIQHCDRIVKRWSKGRRSGEVPYVPSMTFLANIGSRLTSASIQDSPEQLLGQLVRGALAHEGALFFTSPEGLASRVKTRAEGLPEGLCSWVDERMSSALNYSTQTEDAEAGEIVDPNVISLEDKSWRVFLLVSDQGTSDTVIGAIALCNPVTQVPLDVLRALALYLQGELKSVHASQWSLN
jgi:hypothetical protein